MGGRSGNIYYVAYFITPYYVHIVIRYIMEHTWREGSTISPPSMILVPPRYR